MESIICKNCGKAITNINEKVGVARCPCGANYSLSSLQEQADRGRFLKPSKSKVVRPGNISVQGQGRQVTIIRYPHNKIFIFSLVVSFVILFFGFKQDPSRFHSLLDKLWHDRTASIILFAILFLPIYYILVKTFNRITVRLDNFKINISYGPLPVWKSEFSLKNREFDQLFVKKVETRVRTGRSHAFGGHGVHTHLVYTWELWARNKTAEEFLVIKDLQSLEEARYLEQEIEKFYGIKDWFVAGESQ